MRYRGDREGIVDGVRTFGGIIDEQLVEVETVGENHVSDVVASDADAFHRDWILSFQLQFHLFQMCIHRHVHSRYCPRANGPVLELNRHRLIAQFH